MRWSGDMSCQQDKTQQKHHIMDATMSMFIDLTAEPSKFIPKDIYSQKLNSLKSPACTGFCTTHSYRWLQSPLICGRLYDAKQTQQRTGQGRKIRTAHKWTWL